jgi:hypothetical protein
MTSNINAIDLVVSFGITERQADDEFPRLISKNTSNDTNEMEVPVFIIILEADTGIIQIVVACFKFDWPCHSDERYHHHQRTPHG